MILQKKLKYKKITYSIENQRNFMTYLLISEYVRLHFGFDYYGHEQYLIHAFLHAL